jgi:hypothetical protein
MEQLNCIKCNLPFTDVINIIKNIDDQWQHCNCTEVNKFNKSYDELLSEVPNKLVSHSRMMSSQSGRFSRLRKDKNEKIRIVTASLTAAKEMQL